MATQWRRPAQAYTIIELLISIAITLLMMFLIDRLFFDTTAAVGRGTAISDIIAGARSVGKQLREDAEAMTRASFGGGVDNTKGGVLVIINRRIGDWDRDGKLDGDKDMNGILDPEELESITSNPEGVAFIRPDGTEARRFVRSDQLMFIRDTVPDGSSRRFRTLPICPSTEQTFTSTAINSEEVPYVRVWYGHVRRTNPDGTDPGVTSPGTESATGDDNPQSYGALGRDGPNRLSNDWILGRQALFLASDGLATGGIIHAKGAWYNNTDIEAYTELPSALQYLYMGVTDIANYSLHDGKGLGHANGSIVDGVFDASAPNEDKRLWSLLSEGDPSDPDDDIPFPDVDYKNRILEYYTYSKKRLRANPTPKGTALQSWQIAQTHPVLLTHVSDFIVEFAGDYYKVGPHAGKPNGLIDVYQPAGVGNVIAWYVHESLDNPLGDPESDPSQPVTYQIDETKLDSTVYSPLIDDDPDGAEGSYPHVDGAFVWRHDDDEPGESAGSNGWPFLIRVRYRLHDTKGEFHEFNEATGQKESGKWFEHILQVNRP